MPRTGVAAVVTFLAGCGLVIGIDDRREHPGSTGSSATGGAGGTSTSGGSGGSACTEDACVPADAILWLRSDLGLEVAGGELTWVDQVTGQLATANEGAGGAGGGPVFTAPQVLSSDEFNDHAIVRFDGDSARIRLPAIAKSFGDGFTAAFVLRSLGASDYDGFFFLGNEDDSVFTDAIAIGREFEERLRCTIQASYDPHAFWFGIVQASTGLPSLPPTARVLVVTQRATDGSVWFYDNDAIVAKDWGDAVLPANVLRDDSFLGWVPYYGSFEGDIAEVILFNRALSDAERADVEQYLSNKYAIPLTPPCNDCPEVIAEGQATSWSLTAQGNAVVWTNDEGGQVMIMDDATVPAPTMRVLFEAGVTPVRPAAPAFDASHVYWGDRTGAVHRVSLSTQSTQILGVAAEVPVVAVDDATVYAALQEAGIAWLPLTLDSANTRSFQTGNGEKIGDVAVDELHLYVALFGNSGLTDGIYRLPKSDLPNAPLELVALGWAGSAPMVLDNDYVYFVDGKQHVKRVDKQSLVTDTLASDTEVRGLAVDGDHVYFTNYYFGAVKRARPDGMGFTVDTLASEQPLPFGIVTVGNYLVWGNRDGTIVRMPKPP